MPGSGGEGAEVIEFEIRDAVLEEMPVLSDVFRRSSLSNRGDRKNILANPDVLELSDQAVREGRTRVAVSGGRIVGFATVVVGETAVELEDLFVDPEWMRRGIGRALVLDIVATTQARGTRRIEVTANEHARAFYVAAGFVHRGTADTRFGPALRMHLHIAP
jgi:GNAT superfamily N-acetyltransferase